MVERGAVKEVIFACVRDLDGRIPDCKFALYANYFNETQIGMIHNLGNRHNGGSNRFDWFKSCCHHSFKDLCIHTESAWWKLKKSFHQKDIGNYSGGCIICLKSFSVWCVPRECIHTEWKDAGNWSTKRNKQIHGLLNTVHFQFLIDVDHWIHSPFLYITLHFFQEAGDTCPSIQVGKAIVFNDKLLFCWRYIFHIHFFKASGTSVTS